MGFKEKLKQLREERGLTQTELAEEIGVSVGTIRQYESGKRDPNFYTVIKLEKFFHVTVAYLNGNVNEYDCSSQKFISDQEEALLTSFRKLPKEEQEEIAAIINLKLQKRSQLKKNKLNTLPK